MYISSINDINDIVDQICIELTAFKKIKVLFCEKYRYYIIGTVVDECL